MVGSDQPLVDQVFGSTSGSSDVISNKGVPNSLDAEMAMSFALIILFGQDM